MHADLRPFLYRLQTRFELQDDDLAELADCCTDASSVAKDLELSFQGSQPDRLHAILSGWAGRHTLLSDGRRQFSALHLRGDLCEIDALCDGVLEFGVSTLTACRVASFSRRALLDVMTRRPSVARAFLGLAIAENKVLTRWNLLLGRQPAAERLAHFFCELSMRNAEPDERHASSFTLPLNQTELGDLAGLSSVHVNRTLMDLRSAGLIQLRSSELTITNWKELVALASFRPSYLASSLV